MSKYNYILCDCATEVAGRLLFASCAAGAFFQGEASLIAQSTLSAPTRVEVVRRSSGGYAITPGDLILVKVFQEDELDTTARVAKDGCISFPMVGSVVIGGKTLAEATAVLGAALKEYLVHPQVTMRIMDYSKRRFTVLGQVNRPGIYDIPDDAALSVLEGI